MLNDTGPVPTGIGTRKEVSPERLRAAMGHFATGVGVVTACDRDGRPQGSTANAISSLSLHPPLVLACLRRESRTLQAARTTQRWAINVLRSDQQTIAERFARRSSIEKWTGVAHRLTDGVPVLDAALAVIECRTHQIADGGDHMILIGQTIDVAHPPEHQDPLLFFRGGYADLVPRTTVRPKGIDEESLVALPSALGHLRMFPLTLRDAGAGAAALVGDPAGRPGTVVVLHRGCVLGDALRSERCGGRARLSRVVRHLKERSRPGVIIYTRAPGLGVCARCLGEPPASDRASNDELEMAASVARQLDLVDPVVVVGENAEDALVEGRI